ncbi:hypothetical protein CEXT_811711 [Caerostris extrusa]|uniref:Uncharacterized protein n=1 Tax=Caerostris extrusa TaxID=172846 RepID=A0AAV4TZ69_CAEEX|nr:hypothetical protein CEXT_811711 [Caerostris extrusa]
MAGKRPRHKMASTCELMVRFNVSSHLDQNYEVVMDGADDKIIKVEKSLHRVIDERDVRRSKWEMEWFVSEWNWNIRTRIFVEIPMIAFYK